MFASFCFAGVRGCFTGCRAARPPPEGKCRSRCFAGVRCRERRRGFSVQFKRFCENGNKKPAAAGFGGKHGGKHSGKARWPPPVPQKRLFCRGPPAGGGKRERGLWFFSAPRPPWLFRRAAKNSELLMTRRFIVFPPRAWQKKGMAVKTAVDLRPDQFKIEGQHKVITLDNGQRQISFIRGKENVIQSPGKVTILFSSLEKPVKILSGKKFKPGPKPAEIIKDFSLETYQKTVADAPRPKGAPPKPRGFAGRIADAIKLLDELAPKNPAHAELFKGAAFALSVIKAKIERAKAAADAAAQGAAAPHSPQAPPGSQAPHSPQTGHSPQAPPQPSRAAPRPEGHPASCQSALGRSAYYDAVQSGHHARRR